MPYLTKEALSQYLRTGCQRQLRLNLSPDNATYKPERLAQGMPDPQPPRPGLPLIKQAGDTWAAAKVGDLATTFGTAAVIGIPQANLSGITTYKTQDLTQLLAGASAGQFLVEAQYEITAVFEQALGIVGHATTLNLKYGDVRPDLIEVCTSGTFTDQVLPSGETQTLSSGDTRLQLRLIDIKLTSEPSPSYYAEVTYYTLALAAWLLEHGHDQHFVVVPDGAIWPGSHDASTLVKLQREHQQQGTTPTIADLRNALDADLERVPFDTFVYRIRRFLLDELPVVLAPLWRQLPYHVDNRCKGCENLGAPWVNAQGQSTALSDHCVPMALQTDHLSRVAFLTRGASKALTSSGIANVAALAGLQSQDPAFDTHQELRAARTVIAGRAGVLGQQAPVIPPNAGTSAVMPKWSDLHVYLSTDFDLSSAISFAFGLQAFWREPQPYGTVSAAPVPTHAWPFRAFIVDQKDLVVERRELLALLTHLHAILSDAQTRHADTTVQIYVWDRLQYEHLARVIGRHLPAILGATASLRPLAWLFPPEDLLPDPTEVSRNSTITIVREVIQAVLAAPIPHYYTLLDTARMYHLPTLPSQVAAFSIHPLFEDFLSDQIPSERAHDIWTRRPGWPQSLTTLQETIEKRLRALETITRQLEGDLRAVLGYTAPTIQLGAARRPSRLSMDGHLWYAFAKLNAALEEFEVQQIRAMPPHEREARFASALLPRRLTGIAEANALAQLGIPMRPRRRVYQLSPRSREVKVRAHDFDVALAPAAVLGFLDRKLFKVAAGTPLAPVNGPDMRLRMSDVTSVTVVALDRDAGLVVIDPDQRRATMLDDLEAHGVADFSIDVMLDPTYRDTFTKKLLTALQAIANPSIARDNPLVRQALNLQGRGANRTSHTPPADLLWDATTMAATPVSRRLPMVRQALVAHGLGLNPTQWQAWEAALTRRLQLIWGPPGTGKSRTARAVIAGALLEAHQQGRDLRVLVCASTYTAIDNVLLPVVGDMMALLPSALEIHRLRPISRALDASVPVQIDAEFDRANPSQRVVDLRVRLNNGTGLTLVGATVEQVHNLLILNDDPAQQEWFDLILFDEASQTDVGHAILALCALAAGGSVVLAGDPLQLPPIHAAEPPLDLEALVGSIYAFCRRIHSVQPIMLDINYRSNDTLVRFSHTAGYDQSLHSYASNLRLELLGGLPSAAPLHWPGNLYWTSEWAALLDPTQPASCFVYPEGRSSQWNQFEADAVVALTYLLEGRLADGLRGRLDSTGAIMPTGTQPYTTKAFWENGVGIVTPHRAQQGLITSRLQQVFPAVPADLIRGAVDTVERFQGQERDVIIASFALGDPDAIMAEDKFLYSLNRFNVMASRARAKLIVLVTQEIVDHLANDIDVLRASRLLKMYAESFCRSARPMDLGYLQGGASPVIVPGLFKYR